MKHLLAALVLLLLLLTSGCSEISFLNKSLSAVPSAVDTSLWFKKANGTNCTEPCLFGIMIGVTHFKDTPQLLQLHPATKDMVESPRTNPTTAHYSSEKDCWSILLGANSDDVVISLSVLLYGCDQPLRLKDIVLVVGLPSDVTLGGYGVAPNYIFYMNGRLNMELWFEFDVCVLVPWLPITRIDLDDYDARGSTAKKWIGFVSCTEYETER